MTALQYFSDYSNISVILVLAPIDYLFFIQFFILFLCVTSGFLLKQVHFHVTLWNSGSYLNLPDFSDTIQQRKEPLLASGTQVIGTSFSWMLGRVEVLSSHVALTDMAVGGVSLLLSDSKSPNFPRGPSDTATGEDARWCWMVVDVQDPHMVSTDIIGVAPDSSCQGWKSQLLAWPSLRMPWWGVGAPHYSTRRVRF